MFILILRNLIKIDIGKRKLNWMSSFFSNVASPNLLLERDVNCFQSEDIFKSVLKPKKALNV